jgi:hypothetical protein
MHPSVAEAAVVISRTSTLSQEEIGDADQVFELADLFCIASASSSSSQRTGASPLSTSGRYLAGKGSPEP